MPETPDFEKIALALVREPPDMFFGMDQPLYHGEDGAYSSDKQRAADAVAEQLRQAWNARGAADLATVRTRLLDEGAKPDGPAIRMCEVGIGLLDR